MSGSENTNERVLAAAVDNILVSYRNHGNINHLDGHNLPSRSTVEKLLDDLLSILFPGYFTEDHVDALTARYFVGERCVRLLRRLEKSIARVIALEGNVSENKKTSQRNTGSSLLRAISVKIGSNYQNVGKGNQEVREPKRWRGNINSY